MATTSESSSAAERLLQQHAENHHVTVEDAPDDDLPRKTAAPSASLDDFPALGASGNGNKGKSKEPAGPAIWMAKLNTGANTPNGTSRASTPASNAGISTPPVVAGPKDMNLPGRHSEFVVLDPQFIQPRNQLKRPIPDLVKDINRKSRANLAFSYQGSRLRIEATGPQDHAQQAIRDLVNQIGTKQTIRVPIPRSARAHLIGKGGATIKAIQEKSGARVQLPKTDDSQAAGDEDDDALIDVIVEGNTVSAAVARDAIQKIAGDHTATLTSKLKTIPAEIYPFLAGPNNSLLSELEKEHGAQIRIPPHQPWAHPVPKSQNGERLWFAPPREENFIQLAGDRPGVTAARAAIERHAQELQNRLVINQEQIPFSRHQFIIGNNGVPAEDFFAETNCVIILPSDPSQDTVTIIGTEDDVARGVDKAQELSMFLNQSSIDVSRSHKHANDGAPAYMRDVARYLRQRREIERLEKLHQVHISTPISNGLGLPWDLFGRDGKNILKAQKEVNSVVGGHPPSRFATIPVDPFFHAYLKSDVKPQVQNDFGVHVVIPEATEQQLPVLLVFEGESGADSAYQVPKAAPSADELRAFQQGLNDARKHILELIGKQEEIKTETLEVPVKFHDKLRKFIKREQDATTRKAGEIPVRVSVKGTTITMRGTASAVDSLASKSKEFVEQEKEDEKERGFVLKFDFPQKHANHLIGKSGSHINELREKFDVDIQVQNGEVELKGPKAKAERAKAHITSLARTWADETTHTLKIEPKYHRELIGSGGSQITRLQDRYKVHINFPRTARTGKEDDSAADTASDAGKQKRQQGADEVVIRGPKKGADEARDEIFSLYSYLKDNSFTTTITVQQKQLPSLIGAQGSAMDELRQKTGAKVDVPNERNESQDALVEIQIKGTKSQVAEAKKLIEEKKAVFEDTVTKTVEVDKKWHKILIGPGGSTLRDIITKAGGPDDRRLQNRYVQFPKQDADGNAIKVEGRKDVVDKIAASIESIVSERASQVSETVDVPIEKHRSLIGRGGDAKRKLESEFSVSIDIPRQGSGQTGVKIAGKTDAVAKAKEHIQSSFKEEPSETVQVPRKYHNAVSSNGQFFRKLRNDFKVTVDHAGQAPPAKLKSATARISNGATPLITDDPEEVADAHSWNLVDNASTEEGDIPWVLKGTAENVERAKEAINKALEQAKKPNSTGYLILADPSTYRYVIGQGGSKVNAIRKQSGCQIQVPKDQASDEAIEITGTKEGCEKAKDMILEAVREGVASRNRD
ncbi:putative K Homology domain-containing protein [Seiridium cardinale]|uniref:K Homology domain-containing protein n=1 Tax=Seiridium cardinale TaxID=138064 RepID=A0ABR2XNM2_9PEZI